MTGKRFIEILFATPVEYRGKKIGDVGHLEDLGGHELWLVRFPREERQGKGVVKGLRPSFSKNMIVPMYYMVILGESEEKMKR